MSRETSRLAALAKNLHKRGEMYLQPVTYETLVAYLSGYNHALMECGEEDELNRFRDWLHQKIGHHCTLHWSAVIRDVFAYGDKELAKQKLFELFAEFGASGSSRRGVTSHR